MKVANVISSSKAINVDQFQFLLFPKDQSPTVPQSQLTNTNKVLMCSNGFLLDFFFCMNK